jgi:pilus assembly protein CpaC
VLVTPHLAKPLSPGAARMPDDKWVSPSDYESYLLGLTQGRPKNEVPGQKVQPQAQNLPGGFGPQKLD